MDRPNSYRFGNVFCLHVCRCDVAAAVFGRKDSRLERHIIRHLRRIGIHPQRVRLPDSCRHHSRQDGGALYGYPIHSDDGNRCRYKVYRRKRLVPSHQPLRMA